MPDETDAKKILTAALLENWRRPPGCPRNTWMKTIQQDYPPEIQKPLLNEAIPVVVAQNRPLWRLIYVWRYALLVVHVTKEEEFYFKHMSASSKMSYLDDVLLKSSV